MSVRSGLFIKYAVKFVEAKLTVSNDVLVGDVCIDADITVKMRRWTSGTTFTITLYDLPEAKVKQLKELTKAAKGADTVLLASDPDREGEAIAWHLAYVLNLKNPRRIELHEITPSAVEKALSALRPMNQDLIDAQQARRALGNRTDADGDGAVAHVSLERRPEID